MKEKKVNKKEIEKINSKIIQTIYLYLIWKKNEKNIDNKKEIELSYFINNISKQYEEIEKINIKIIQTIYLYFIWKKIYKKIK